MEKKFPILFLMLALFSSIVVGPVSVLADEEKISEPVVSTEKIDIDDTTSAVITTEAFQGYTIVTVNDNQGNTSIADSRLDYVLENGEKIYVEISSTDMLANEPTAFAVPAWQKIRTSTVTAAFDRAIKDLAVGTILSKIKAVLGWAYSAASLVKASYEKPDLKGSKAFYIRTVTYGYTYQSGREGRHTYSLDSKSRKIGKTDHF